MVRRSDIWHSLTQKRLLSPLCGWDRWGRRLPLRGAVRGGGGGTGTPRVPQDHGVAADVSEVASTIVFMASDDAGYISGEVISVGGAETFPF